MQILGYQIGKVKAPEVKPKPRTGDIGVMSSSIYQGRDFTFYNPDDLLTNKGETIYKRMMRDDQVKAAIHFKKNAIISRDWYFDVEHDDETGEADAEQQKIADIFTEVIAQIKGAWSDTITEILSAINNGFSVCEKIYKPVLIDGKTYWGIEDIKLRPFETFNDGGFVVDRHGNLKEIKQTLGGADDIVIPFDKVIHFVNQPDIDRYYGESDLRAAHRAWWSKDINIKFRNIHLERHAHGFVVARVEGSLSDPQNTALEDALSNITLNTSLKVPSNVELDTIQPLSTQAYKEAIQQDNTAIARSVLVPNLLGLSEQGPHGSRSLGDTQFTGFLWVLNAIDSRLCETINDQIFRQLAIWNFGTEDFPKYRTEPLSDQEQLDLAKGWAELIKAGAVTKSDSDERHIRRQLGMPDKIESEDDEPMEVPDISDWINQQPDPEEVKREMAEKPWLNRVNFARIERQWTNADNGLSDKINAIMLDMGVSIEKQVQKIGGDRSWGNVAPAEAQSVSIPKKDTSALRKTLRVELTGYFNDAYDGASRELPQRKFRRIGIGMDKTQSEKFINSRMMQLTGIIEQKVLDIVALSLQNAITYDKSLTDTIAALFDDLKEYIPDKQWIEETAKRAGHWRAINKPARIENIVRTETGKAINMGRQALFSDPQLKGFVQAYEYSAILDDSTTDICEHLNGKILRDFGHYMPPNHYQCRSLLIPVTQLDEWSGKESPSPRKEPMAGFK
jgi:SPP1 gp7 family putative phage head morphogenesis protein